MQKEEVRMKKWKVLQSSFFTLHSPAILDPPSSRPSSAITASRVTGSDPGATPPAFSSPIARVAQAAGALPKIITSLVGPHLEFLARDRRQTNSGAPVGHQKRRFRQPATQWLRQRQRR